MSKEPRSAIQIKPPADPDQQEPTDNRSNLAEMLSLEIIPHHENDQNDNADAGSGNLHCPGDEV